MKHFFWQGQALVLRCKVQTNARADEFCGLQAERLKIRLKATPVEGKANRQLIAFIADAFAVSRSAVTIFRGSSSRHKDIRIHVPTNLPQQCLLESRSQAVTKTSAPGDLATKIPASGQSGH